MVSQQLQRRYQDDGRQLHGDRGHGNDALHPAPHLEVVKLGEGDEPPAPGRHLFDIALHLSSTGLRDASTNTGMFSSIRAMGPCFISPAA